MVGVPGGDRFVVGAVWALAVAIMAAIISAKAAVIGVLDIRFLLGTVGFRIQRGPLGLVPAVQPEVSNESIEGNPRLLMDLWSIKRGS
jgi:hypothetical protein